jgi:hypothetical protein
VHTPHRSSGLTLATLLVLAVACGDRRSTPAGAIVADASPLGALRGDPTDSLRAFIGDDAQRTVHLRRVARDDRDRARLCGYLVSEPSAALRVPTPPGVDTGAPRIALAYLQGAGARGMRYLVAGFRSEYVYSGLTRDGVHRIDVRMPVRVVSSPEARGASEAPVTEPSLEVLDAFARSVRPRLPVDSAPVARGTLPDSTAEPDLAVPDIRDLPDAPLRLDAACPAATVGTLGLARIERIFRVRVPAGHTLSTRARASVGGVVLAVDYPAVPDSARRNVRPVVEDSVVALEADRDAIIRLLYAPVLRKEPDQAFITVSVALAKRATP